jgi:hypothetical protein
MRDVLGAWLSVLCMVHCMLPLLLVSLGASVGLNEVAHQVHEEWLHVALLLPIVIILAFSLPKSYALHRDIRPAILACVGVVVLVIAVTIATAVETPLTILGSVFVISAHLLNRRGVKAGRLVLA